MGEITSLVRPRIVSGGGDGLVSHAGIVWLAETAELSGLAAGLVDAMRGVPQRRHVAGRTLGQVVLALADGATCLSDLAAMRDGISDVGPSGFDSFGSPGGPPVAP